MAEDFSKAHLAEILKEINNSGYTCSSFEDYDKSQYQILIRHDIDVSIDAALNMARVEHENAIRATYFVWTQSPFYNCLTEENIKKIKEIIMLGHDIGLHFDALEANFVDKMMVQKNILHQICEKDISIVSFHRPNKDIFMSEQAYINGMQNVYSRDLLSKYYYISDSRKEWKEHCICKYISEKKYKNIYVLLHPIWWENEINSKRDFLNYILKQTCENWDEHIKV